MLLLLFFSVSMATQPSLLRISSSSWHYPSVVIFPWLSLWAPEILGRSTTVVRFIVYLTATKKASTLLLSKQLFRAFGILWYKKKRTRSPLPVDLTRPIQAKYSDSCFSSVKLQIQFTLSHYHHYSSRSL